MKWWKCMFEPLDILAGADARRLEDGGWGHVGTLAPAAFAGAVRTLILQQHGYCFGIDRTQQSSEPAAEGETSPRKIGERLGVPDQKGQICPSASIRFAGPFYTPATDFRLLFPVPRHLLRGDYDWTVLSPLEDEGVCADARLDGAHLLHSSNRDAQPVDCLTHCSGSQAGLCELLRDAAQVPSTLYWRDLRTLWQTERRYGHKRETTGAVADGFLFSRANLRFKEEVVSLHGIQRRVSGGFAGLVAGIDDLIDVDTEHTVRLGGDARLARLRLTDATSDLAPAVALKQVVQDALRRDAVIVLYLATPGIFVDGWRPHFGEKEGVKLIAAAVDRPRVVSGWDYARRRPKPHQRVVPAGAVYFYRVLDKQLARDFIDMYHLNQTVCSPEHGLTGYGLAMFGLWKPLGTTT